MLPCILPLRSNLIQAWLPSMSCPSLFEIVKNWSSLRDSAVLISFKTFSFIVGRLPSYASGFHPCSINLVAIWSRLLGLNGMDLVLRSPLKHSLALYPTSIIAFFVGKVSPFRFCHIKLLVSSMMGGKAFWRSVSISHLSSISFSMSSTALPLSKGNPLYSCRCISVANLCSSSTICSDGVLASNHIYKHLVTLTSCSQ